MHTYCRHPELWYRLDFLQWADAIYSVDKRLFKWQGFGLFYIPFVPQLADFLHGKVWNRHFAELRWLAARSILQHVSALLAGICVPTSRGTVRTHSWVMALSAPNLGPVKLLPVTLLWHFCLGGLHCFSSCPLQWRSYQRVSTWVLCLIAIIYAWKQNLCLSFNNVTLGKR